MKMIHKLFVAGLTLISVIILAGVIHAQSKNPYQNLTEKAVIKEVYDGDTIVVEVTKLYRVRMLDCWSAEVRTKDKKEKERGIEAKNFLGTLLKEGDEVLIEIPTTNKFEDSISLGRVLGYVWKDVDKDGKLDNISEKMVQGGFATKKKETNK